VGKKAQGEGGRWVCFQRTVTNRRVAFEKYEVANASVGSKREESGGPSAPN